MDSAFHLNDGTIYEASDNINLYELPSISFILIYQSIYAISCVVMRLVELKSSDADGNHPKDQCEITLFRMWRWGVARGQRKRTINQM